MAYEGDRHWLNLIPDTETGRVLRCERVRKGSGVHHHSVLKWMRRWKTFRYWDSEEFLLILLTMQHGHPQEWCRANARVT